LFKKSTLQKIKQPLLRRDILTVWLGCWLGALNGADPFPAIQGKVLPDSAQMPELFRQPRRSEDERSRSAFSEAHGTF